MTGNFWEPFQDNFICTVRNFCEKINSFPSKTAKSTSLEKIYWPKCTFLKINKCPLSPSFNVVFLRDFDVQVIPLQHNIEIGGKEGKQWLIKVKKLSLLNLLLIND